MSDKNQQVSAGLNGNSLATRIAVDDFFELLSSITAVEIIAADHSIHDLQRLNKRYGRGRWRKLKGQALARLPDGKIIMAEVHWYEAHGIGKREIKIKGPVVDQ